MWSASSPRAICLRCSSSSLIASRLRSDTADSWQRLCLSSPRIPCSFAYRGQRLNLSRESKLTMHVHEYMSPAPFTIATDVGLQTALRLLHERAVRRLPANDATGRIAGVVTERDLLLALSHYLTSPIDVEVVLSGPLVTTSPDTPLAQAALLMLSNQIARLPPL